MPVVAVLLIIAFLSAALWLLTHPVSPERLDRFAANYSLTLNPSSRSSLQSYLAFRRRARVTGVLIAAGIGLLGSIPDNRLEFAFVPLLIGWFAGAIAIEVVHRRGSIRASEPMPVAYWWSGVPAAAAVIAVLWMAAAVMLRSEGARPETLLGWGSGALATLLVLRTAVGYLRRHRLSDLDPSDTELASATTVDAVRGLTIGGLILALQCLANLWMRAVPGPYAESPDLFTIVWLVAAAALILALTTAPESIASSARRSRKWLAAAVIAALPLAWAAPVRLAQEPPFSAAEAQASAQVRLTRPDGLPAAQAELGLKPSRLDGPGDSVSTELIGRVDVARPAPEGTLYQLFAFDRRTNAAVQIYGADGASWYGRWSVVLPVRYSWLADVVGPRDHGFAYDPSAVSADPESSLLWFRSALAEPGRHSAHDLQLVLMLIRRDDSYIYWAATVPSTAKDAVA